MLLDFAGSVQRVDPLGEMRSGFHLGLMTSRWRWSALRSNSATAAASAALSFGASTVPRCCPCFLMSDMRQLRSLAAVGLCLVIFFVGLRKMVRLSQNC